MGNKLISTRADHIESKSLSNRKTGKEAHVLDFVACSFINVMYGTRLRVRGEHQEDNVEDLLSNLPKFTSVHKLIRLTFDRDYGKVPFVEANSKIFFDISTIATIFGSTNSFILLSESATFIKKCIIKKDIED